MGALRTMSIADRSKRAASRRSAEAMAATGCDAGHPYVEGSFREAETKAGRATRVCLVCARQKTAIRTAELAEAVNESPPADIETVIGAVYTALSHGYPFEQICVAIAEARHVWAGPATPNLTLPAYRVACPLCAAPPGSPCVVATPSLWRPMGAFVQNPHTMRVQVSYV